MNEKKWGKIASGYGWVYRKKIKFICRAEKLVPTVPKNSTLSAGDVSEYRNCDMTGISATQIKESDDAGGLAMRTREGLD